MSSAPPEPAVADRPHAALAFVLTSTSIAGDIDATIAAHQEALAIHERLAIPLALACGGELLEVLAWEAPDLIKQLRRLQHEGLVELLGMPYENTHSQLPSELVDLQLAEGLRVLQHHLELGATTVRTAYLPATTLWRAHSLATALTNESLANGGYQWALIDDRMNDVHQSPSAAAANGLAQLWAGRRIRDSSLCVTPIATALRNWFPVRGANDLRWWRELAFAATRVEPDQPVLTWLGDPLDALSSADRATEYERSILRIRDEAPVEFVGLSTWLATHVPLRDADLDAEPRWSDEATGPDERAPRDTHAVERVALRTLALLEGETSELAALARRRSLAANNGETAAQLIAASARWLATPRELAWCEVDDVDDDGHDEVILGNDRLHIVITPSRGARVTTLALATSAGGALAVAPPGALLLADGEDDRWEVRSYSDAGPSASVELEDVESHSPHKGAHLTFTLDQSSDHVVARYRLRRRESVLVTALSPDNAYLRDAGRAGLRLHVDDKSCVATGGRVRARLAVVDTASRTTATVWRDAPFPSPPHAELVAIKVRGADLTVELSAGEIRPPSSPSG